jgi:hypothetical protein
MPGMGPGITSRQQSDRRLAFSSQSYVSSVYWIIAVALLVLSRGDAAPPAEHLQSFA